MEPVRQIVKRPNETIGIVPNGKQRITLLVRRLYSVILLFSQQQGEREEYSAVLADMLAAAHSAGSNRTQVKEVLRDIRAIGVDWNVRDGEREVWKNVGLIEEPGLIDGRGTPTIVTWKLPKMIRARLLDPRGFFTRISLEMMTRLRSGASIALYEICCQYVSNDHGKGEGGLTNRAPIADWMPRLTGSRKTVYEYKFLKRDVLLTAIEEINEITDLRVELVEHKIGRRVGELQFRVFRKEIFDSTRTALAPVASGQLGVRVQARRSVLESIAAANATPAAADEGALSVSAPSGSMSPHRAATEEATPKRRASRMAAASATRDLWQSPAATSPDGEPPGTVPAAGVPTIPTPTASILTALPTQLRTTVSPTEAADALSPEGAAFYARMLAIGTPPATARRLLTRYEADPAYLRRHLDFVEQRIRSTSTAPLVNPVAFLQKALDHGYAESLRPAAGVGTAGRGMTTVRAARATSRRDAAELIDPTRDGNQNTNPDEFALLPAPAQVPDQAALLRRAEVWVRFQALPHDTTRATLVDAFLAQSGATLKTFYRKNGVNNMIVKAALTDWLIREQNF